MSCLSPWITGSPREAASVFSWPATLVRCSGRGAARSPPWSHARRRRQVRAGPPVGARRAGLWHSIDGGNGDKRSGAWGLGGDKLRTRSHALRALTGDLAPGPRLFRRVLRRGWARQVQAQPAHVLHKTERCVPVPTALHCRSELSTWHARPAVLAHHPHRPLPTAAPSQA